jgi:hypothetical protein
MSAFATLLQVLALVPALGETLLSLWEASPAVASTLKALLVNATFAAEWMRAVPQQILNAIVSTAGPSPAFWVWFLMSAYGTNAAYL